MNANGADRHGWAPTNSANLYCVDGGVCVRACEHMRAGMMRLQYTIIIYDPGGLRLIMIIIKIIILYFIQIRHTDDFPPTGTRRVIDKRFRHFR